MPCHLCQLLQQSRGVAPDTVVQSWEGGQVSCRGLVHLATTQWQEGLISMSAEVKVCKVETSLGSTKGWGPL